MLGITIPGGELWDPVKEKFIATPEETLQLEHSLVSISKWEAITKKAFLGKDQKTREETILYVKCMTVSPVADDKSYEALTAQNFKAISDYIDDSMTATVFNEAPGMSRNSGEFVTSELVYYWMVALTIPPEYQYWHFNRLITLIRIANLKNQTGKKENKRDAIARRRAMNAERKARLHTTG